MTAERMTCATCGREVAARVVRPPRVNRGRAVPALRVPVRHKRPGSDQWCQPKRRRST